MYIVSNRGQQLLGASGGFSGLLEASCGFLILGLELSFVIPETAAATGGRLRR